MLTKAIILKKQNTNEYDQWVICYTEELGKLKAVAKSILKPSSVQALHLDVFNLVEFELISGRGMPIITGAQTANSYVGVKSSVIKTAVAYFFIEALDRMVLENDKDEKLWFFLVSFLGELDKDNSNSLTLLCRGQARLLDILGYFPETSSCKTCDDNLDNDSFGAFNYNLGGIVCKKCFLTGYGGILMSQNDFDLIRRRGNNEENKYYTTFSKKQRCPLSELGGVYSKSILDGMFEYISGGKFYSLELLNMVR